MSPLLEVGHVWVVVAVWGWVEANLIVVHLVGDQSWDGRWLSAGTDVLTIPSAACGAAWLLVMFQETRLWRKLTCYGHRRKTRQSELQCWPYRWTRTTAAQMRFGGGCCADREWLESSC